MTLTVTVGKAQAQPPPLPPAGYYAAQQPDYAAVASRDEEIAALKRRLDANEAQLQMLLRQSEGQVVPAGLAGPKGAAADSVPGPKVVELITKPQVRVFGRAVFDQGMFDDDGVLTSAGTPLQEDTGFRQLRIGATGTIYENIKGQVEVEIKGGALTMKDCYIEAENIGYWGCNVRAGFFKEPYSMEEVTSDTQTSFMERSISRRAFAPSRNLGLMAYGYVADNEDVTWMIGTFRDGSTETAAEEIDNSGDWCGTGRVAWNPYYDEPSGGRYLAHLGGAYSFRSTAGTSITFATGQEVSAQPGFLSVTVPDDNTFSIYGLEGLVIWGPASLQTELYLADTGTYQFWGGYLQLGYFLTGEHLGYRRDIKVPDRVKPFEDFFRVRTDEGICTGRGAWQLLARLSHTDLDQAGLTTATRGRQTDLAAGVNWFWNPYCRMMFNYVYADVERANGSGQPQEFGIRWQIDF